jgi:hypothetical protein
MLSPAIESASTVALLAIAYIEEILMGEHAESREVALPLREGPQMRAFSATSNGLEEAVTPERIRSSCARSPRRP